VKPPPPPTDWSAEERAAMIEQMTHAKNVFYELAVAAGHHQFLEFAGLMSEYLKLCTEAHEAGNDFSALPMKEHHAAYIAEKLECIYGLTLKRSLELTKAFLVRLFGTTEPLKTEHAIVLSYLRLRRAANVVGRTSATDQPSTQRAAHRVELLDELITRIAEGSHGGASSNTDAVSAPESDGRLPGGEGVHVEDAKAVYNWDEANQYWVLVSGPAKALRIVRPLPGAPGARPSG